MLFKNFLSSALTITLVFCFFAFVSEAQEFVPCEISQLGGTRLGGVANGYISTEYIKQYLSEDDPNECEGEKYNSSLYLTIYNLRLDLFELFLNNPYGIKGNLFVVGTNKISILSYATRWATSLSPVTFKFVDRIIEEAPSLINKQNPNGSFPIHYAALSGDKKVFDKIASRLTKKEIRVLGEYGKDVLHYAAQMPFRPFEAEDDPKTIAKLDAQSELIRHLVVERNFDVNSRDNRGYTPLLLATAQPNKQAIQTLINLGARLDVVNQDGYGLLDFLVYSPINTIYHRRPEGMISNEEQKKYMRVAEERRLAIAQFFIENLEFNSPEAIQKSISYSEMELEDLKSIVKRDSRSFYKYAVPGYEKFVSYLRSKLPTE